MDESSHAPSALSLVDNFEDVGGESTDVNGSSQESNEPNEFTVLLGRTFELRASFEDLEVERKILVHNITAASALVRAALSHVPRLKGEEADFAELVLEERQEQVNRLIIRTEMCTTLATDKSSSVDSSPPQRRSSTLACPITRLQNLIAELKEEEQGIHVLYPQLSEIIQGRELTTEELDTWVEIRAVLEACTRLISVLSRLSSHTLQVDCDPVCTLH